VPGRGHRLHRRLQRGGPARRPPSARPRRRRGHPRRGARGRRLHRLGRDLQRLQGGARLVRRQRRDDRQPLARHLPRRAGRRTRPHR
jgi:hypothetical protein